MTGPDVYPFYIAIGILGLLTAYQVHLSRSFRGNFKDKMYYYYSHIITLMPIIMYIYKVIDIYIFNTYSNFLGTFYIEWSITSPLIFMNIGRLIQFPIYKHIVITLIDSLMILSGYISYVFENPIVVYTSYGVGVFCYLLLNYIFISRFILFNKNAKLKHALIPTSIYRDRVRYRFYHTFIYINIIFWSLYPITHMLYKQGIISLQTTVNIFLALDVLCKGVFTILLLGSREIYRTPTSWLGFLTKKALSVHPLEVNISHHDVEDLCSSLEIRSNVNKPNDPTTILNPNIYTTLHSTYVGTLETIYENHKTKKSLNDVLP
jgi:bacteriorhodopsin